jgi:uncharacterized membrane protein YeaQ/YmgE (transglycosylase-associated protein family)
MWAATPSVSAAQLIFPIILSPQQAGEESRCRAAQKAVPARVPALPTPARIDIAKQQVYKEDAQGPSCVASKKKEVAHMAHLNVLEWIVVGLIAGWLAGQVMKGGGYGVVVDIILGILGGLLGGWIFGKLGIGHSGGILGSLIVAFLGAVILVGISRILKRAA